MALDAAGQFGPEVDGRLGGEEPMVDQWESGELVPTPHQIRALATLTGMTPEFFYQDDPPAATNVFICGRGTRTAKKKGPSGPPLRRPQPVRAQIDDDAPSKVTPARAREVREQIERERAELAAKNLVPTPAEAATGCPMCGRPAEVECFMPPGRCRRPA
jgi:transcriptional regulator with XRE-family HTH domain